MSLATLIEHPTDAASALGLTPRRTPRLMWLVLVILVSWGAEYGVYSAFEPHGAALRHELRAAAALLHTQLVLQPTPALRHAIREHFPEENVEVITDGLWPPAVAVRVNGLSRDDCLDALHNARRIDGPVVIALQGYGATTDCREQNDMTWWLMP